MTNNFDNKTGYFEIAREQPDVSPDEFLQRYFVPERPVIIEGVGVSWLAKQRWTEQYIRDQLAKARGAETASLWYWMERDTLAGDYQTPEIVSVLLDSEDIFPRAKSMRIWIHKQDNVSSWHYDTNMVSVFNVQVTGKKEWYLVSPDTPLDCYPFINFAIMNGNDEKTLRKKNYTRFNLNEGDMLYIPPLWFHKVISGAEENISLNWVLTKKATTVSSKSLLRELERYQLNEYLSQHPSAWGKKLFKTIDAKVPGYLRSRWSYPVMIKHTQSQRRLKLLRRTFEEISMLGKAVWHANKVITYFDSLKPVKKLAKTPPLKGH